MERKRKFNLTEEQIKTINENQGKLTLMELATLLDYNYTNLSSALIQNKIIFEGRKSYIRVSSPEDMTMRKGKNEKGELLLTEDLLNQWFA